MAEAIEIKSCPMCGNDAPAAAPRCTCGYVFSSAQPTGTAVVDVGMSPDEPGDGWRAVGWFFAAAGAIGLVFSFYMDTTVEAPGIYGSTEVVNLGLQFNKGLAVIGSLFGIMAGLLCLGVGAIVAAINQASRPQ